MLTMLPLLQSCVSGSNGQDSYCAIAKPIHDSPLDTAETRDQILAHNAKWVETCEPAN